MKKMQEQEQRELQKQQEEEKERLEQQKQLEEQQREREKLEQEKQAITEQISTGDAVRTRVRRRHPPGGRKSPTPIFKAPPIIQLSNGDVSTVINKAEIETPKIIEKSEIVSVPVQEPNLIENTTPVRSQAEQSSDVMTTNQKLLMDMLYANQAVASKQIDSDEGSDETGSTENETSESSVSVKDMASKMQSMDISNRLKPPPTDEDVPPVVVPPPVVQKDSDIMWEKLINQSCHVSFKIA